MAAQQVRIVIGTGPRAHQETMIETASDGGFPQYVTLADPSEEETDEEAPRTTYKLVSLKTDPGHFPMYYAVEPSEEPPTTA